MSLSYLPFALPTIEKDEINEVVDTLQSNWITTGPKTKRFEEEFSRYLGAKHAIAVNSCTAALHLSLDAIGIHSGDKVITSPYTFTSTGETIRYLNAEPLFVDIDEKTFNINPYKIEETINRSGKSNSDIKAIIPVHFAGQACEMKYILEIANKYNLRVIEDAAHALPTTYNGNLIGTNSDFSCFSFYATKTLTTGEGGMLVTDNDKYAERAKIMRLHGINRDVFNRYISKDADWYYEVIAPGFKYNMSDIAAAIGIHQLKKIEKFRVMRENIAEFYNDELKNIDEIQIPFLKNKSDAVSWHLYVIKLKLNELKIDRNQFILEMRKNGIGTSVHFIPLHIQPYYVQRYHFKPEDYPVSYNVYNQVVSLPIYPRMTEGDMKKVVNAIRKIIFKNNKKVKK